MNLYNLPWWSAPQRALWLVLAFAIFISFFFNIWHIPLFDVDEGAFSQATREMFLRHDFISTYLNGQPRHDKPILIYWLQAASTSLFGFNEFAFRLPSALSSLLWALVIFAFAKRILGDSRQALIAALLMATSLAIVVIGKAATADALLNLFIAATMFSLFLFLQQQQPRYLYLSAAFCGLGVLTKGPVALAIPAAVSLLYCLSYGDWRGWLRLLTAPWAWLIFLLIVLPWPIVQYMQQGDAFIQGFFFKHNVGRFQQAMEGHSGGPWFYLPVLLVGFIPYTALLVLTLSRSRALWQQPWARFVLLWFAVVFVLFSLAATKLPHYIIYGFSGLFLLLASQAPSTHSGSAISAKFWAFLPQMLLLVFLFALPWGVDYSLPHLRDPYLQAALHTIWQHIPTGYFMAIGLGFSGSVFFLWDNRFALLYKLIASGLFLSFLISALVLPLVANVQQKPIVAAAHIAKDQPQPLVMWRLHMPSFSVYSGRIAALREPVAGDLVITKSKHLKDLSQHEVLYNQQGIALVHLAEE